MSTANKDSQIEPTDDELQKASANAQLEKLNLEINQLRSKPRWLDPLLQILPVATAFIGILAFVLSAYQYFAAQRRARTSERIEQRLKIEGLARADLAQLIQFPADQKQTVTQMEYLLMDLARLQKTLEIQTKNDDDSHDYSGQESMTTQILGNLIQRDLDFNQSRNVLFADTVLADCEPYKTFLQQNPNYIENILAHEEDALGELRRKAPEYFPQLTYDEAKKQYNEPKGPAVSRSQFRQFEQLMNSFADHWALLSDEASKSELIKEFQAHSCNAALTKYKFGRNFNPKDDPKTFDECLK